MLDVTDVFTDGNAKDAIKCATPSPVNVTLYL